MYTVKRIVGILSFGGLEDRSSGISVWNRLTPEEESVVLQVAMEQTDLPRW